MLVSALQMVLSLCYLTKLKTSIRGPLLHGQNLYNRPHGFRNYFLRYMHLCCNRTCDCLALVNTLFLQGSREIADFNVTVPHKHPENATNVSCKVSFELDLHGLVRCTQATHCHKIEVVEEAPAAATAPKADAAALAEGAVKTEGEPAVKIDGENGDASNMDTDPPVGPPVPEDVKPTASKKQKKVCCICALVLHANLPESEENRLPACCEFSCIEHGHAFFRSVCFVCASIHDSPVHLVQVSQEAAFTQVFLTDLSRETKNRLLEEEGQMASADSLQRATDEAKNALEEYTYSLRSKVQAECAPFVKEVDAAALVTELNAMENWLYEDGEDETKSVSVMLLQLM